MLYEKQIVKEIKGYSNTGYELYINNTLVTSVYIKGFVRTYNDKSYYILIDTQGNLIADAFSFINGDMDGSLGNKNIKLRELAYTSLKLLYSFMELNHINKVNDLFSIPFSRLSEFLSGGYIKGNYIDYDLTTIRTNNTYNKYLFIYRKYSEFLSLDSSYFKGAVRTVSHKNMDSGFFSHANRKTYERFGHNKKVQKLKTVPKYIKPDEYLSMINLLKNEQNCALEIDNTKLYVDSLREEIIITLMYRYGMRIGEVLGLTLEDITVNDNNLNNKSAVITIRNRLTDKNFQHAKGCMDILSITDYQRPSYHEVGLGKAFGCETITIFNDTYQLLQDYIHVSRSIRYLSQKCRKNLKTKNVADKVTNSKIKINRYIFISSYGTLVDKKTHNTYIKDKIFSNLGIVLDKNTRKNNLNHRFRHGFAMYKKNIENYDLHQLKEALRHTSISSCLIYLNPTEEEMAKKSIEANKFLNESGVKI